jgi:hypothetical protein
MQSKTSAALMLFLTFLLGAVAGGVAVYLYERPVIEMSRPRGRQPRNITDELAQGLNLDVAQKEKIAEIVSRSRERYRALSHQFRPHYDAIRDETREEMRSVLREDQKARFEEIISKMDRRREKKDRPPPR